MELYEERYNETTKKSKIPMIIGISIIVLIIITVLLIYGIIYLKSTVTKITLDGADASDLEEIFYIEESGNSSELYIPIRKIAKYFGYQDFRGDYKYKSEDESKCYVKNEYETAMFTLDSNTIVKTRGDSDYEYVDLDQKVFEKDGELYTTIDGVKKAFNVEFLYEPQKRNIEIYTMDYLVNFYATHLKLTEYEAEFSDKKAIFENMLIIQENGLYGVAKASTGESILETKYDLIKYLPNTQDFLVRTNGKYGILSKEAEVKVKSVYDEIKIMDNENGLYLVKQNNLYGVVDVNGNVIIEPEYQQIGINNMSSFAQNGIESQYILLNELIPIKSNNLWALFNINGEQVTEFEFTSLGCIASKVANSYPVLVVPSYKIIVVAKNNFYNLISTSGQKMIPTYVLDSVYMRTNSSTGENSFYMTFNGQTQNIEERLAEYIEQ